MSEFVEVKTADLVGAPLDWAVAQVEKVEGLVIRRGKPAFEMEFDPEASADEFCLKEYKCWLNYSPSTHWSQGGPLIDEFGVLLSPKESMVHVHGGPNAGWQESGSWGATIFRKGEHRRKAHNHPTEPLVAAMRCVVGWSLGETVSVPKELLS